MGSVFRGGVFSFLLCCGLAAQTPGARAPAPESENQTEEVPAAARPGPRGTDEHLHAFFERYAWIVPDTTGSKATLGFVVFVSLALAIGVAARVADVQNREFARCCGQAMIVFAMIAVHTSVVFASQRALAGVVIVDAILWFSAAWFFFQASILASTVMLIICFLASLVGVLLLEVAASILQMIGRA